jgi:hypothetical protein
MGRYQSPNHGLLNHHLNKQSLLQVHVRLIYVVELANQLSTRPQLVEAAHYIYQIGNTARNSLGHT